MESFDLEGVKKLIQELKPSPPRGVADDPKIVVWWEGSEWAGENWHIPFGAVSAYFVMVWVLPLFISKPYKNRTILFIWNAILGVGSTLGFFYLAYGLAVFVVKNGVKALICGDLFLVLEENPGAIWVEYFFVWSKFLELGDTVWLTVAQRPVIFLHWYHHITVLLYTWLGFVQHNGMGAVFIVVNLFVHAIMYTYYAATQSKTLKPYFAPIAPYITSIQLTQMVVGVAATIAGTIWSPEESCLVSQANSFIGGVMYFSYFLLFLQFAIKRFCGTKKDKRKRA